MFTSNFYPSNGIGVSYTDSGFQSFLEQSLNSFCQLDLSNATLLECIDELIKMKSRISPYYGRNYGSLKYNLLKVQNQFGCILMPHQITEVFWHNFIPYLINNGLALSSITTLCSQLRTTLSWASRFGARINPTFDLIRLPSYCHQQVALTPDDVSHIYHFDISKLRFRPQYKRRLTQIRDMFVLSCNLGQRHSDMGRIDKSCFSHNVFSIMQQKTGIKAKVYLDRMCIDLKTTYNILEKYNYEAPYKGDISNFNKGVKELLKIIGFSEEIKRETRINGNVQTEFIPKWKLISSHTARRTFATVNILRGLKATEIRRATGHKTDTAFDKYICYFDD